MNVQEAGDAPRFRHTNEGVALESGVPRGVVEELVDRGHKITQASGVFGGYQAIEIDSESGRLIGGTELRKDGIAAGY